MALARIYESLDHRDEERPRSARRLDGEHSTKITIGGVPSQVEDEFDDPATGEHLAVLAGFVDLEHAVVYFLSEVERQLPLDDPLVRGHRVPPKLLGAFGVSMDRVVCGVATRQTS